MFAQGRVENGVVVPAHGVHFPEGELVTVVTRSPGHGNESAPISQDRQQALLQLIGICKSDNPPNDEQVERILEQEWMKKHG